MNKFNSPSLGKLQLDKVVTKISEFIREDPKYDYDVVIGTDSQNYKDHTYFVSAIIVHRKGAGGRFYWQKSKKQKREILRDRMYEEATMSIKIAEELMELLKKETALDYNLEIHVDIGSKGKTKAFINEIVGMIKGIGFKVKTKPESYAASTVADRYT